MDVFSIRSTIPLDVMIVPFFHFYISNYSSLIILSRTTLNRCQFVFPELSFLRYLSFELQLSCLMTERIAKMMLSYRATAERCLFGTGDNLILHVLAELREVRSVTGYADQ